jgi:phosphoglycerol transferase MdoB-like AlkP superfamily enzyme
MTFKTKYTQVLTALILSLLLLSAVRVFFYFSYFDYFSALTLSETLASFFMGFRVDIMIIFTFTALLWVALLLPFHFVYNKTYRTFLGTIWGLFVAGVVFFNIGDSLYFGFVNRHLSDELKIIGNDVGILVDMAKDYYPLQTISGTIIFFVIVYFFYKIFSAKIIKKEAKKREWINILLIFIIAFVGIRGKLSGMSFGISDAFAVNKLQSGNLALNGFFCFYRASDRKSINHSVIKLPQAVKNVKKAITSQKTLYPNRAYPLMRHYKQTPKRSYNIVIVMVESLSAKYIDALAHNDYGVTPNFDKMAKNGILFTNFYANGQRSQEGITSIYTGIIQPVGFEKYGEGLELYGLSYLGKEADANGYTTIAMQSSDRGSFRIDKLSRLAGFEDYYGAEDMPKSHEEHGNPHFGVWDGDMFRFLSSKLHTIKEPFLSFCFTASTHAPYYSPGKKWEKYPQSVKTEGGFLNTLSYTDAKIGEFMQRCSKEPWFNRTIFLFTGDHANQAKQENPKHIKGTDVQMPAFHIPLIVYAPKIFKARIDKTVGSQIDIKTTIMDYLGWQDNFTEIGNSLFDTTVKTRFAFAKQGSTVSLTDGRDTVNYNFKNFVNTKENNNSKRLQTLLLSIDSAQANLLKSTHWMKE